MKKSIVSHKLIRQLTWWASDVDTWLVLLLLLGVVLIWTRYWKAGRVLVCVTGFFVFVVCLSPIPDFFLTYFENRFERPAHIPDDVTGFIVIGFGIDRRITQDRNFITFNRAAQREIVLVELYKKYPDKKFVYTAGGVQSPAMESLADIMKKQFKKLTLELPNNIIFEGKSLDTRENAKYTYRLIKPKPHEKWVLVTSALNMSRAMGSFKKVGWKNLIAYPVNYNTTKKYDMTLNFSFTHGFRMWKLVTYELLGLINYRLTGYIDELIPSSDPPAYEI